MTRFAVGIEYDGSDFAGWQTQPGARRGPASLEAALAPRAATIPWKSPCAGRTDAGVHARAQVAHFDTRRDAQRARAGARAPTPICRRHRAALGARRCRSISTRAIQRAGPHLPLLHPESRRARPALARGRAAFVHQPLEVEPHAGRGAAAGRHPRLQRLPRRRMPGEAHRCASSCSSTCSARATSCCSRCTANAFLHHMVRNIAGLLIQSGRARRRPGLAAELLAGTRPPPGAGDRAAAGPVPLARALSGRCSACRTIPISCASPPGCPADLME